MWLTKRQNERADQLDRIENDLKCIIDMLAEWRGEGMANVQEIIDAVNNEKTVIDGVTTLLDGIHQQLADVKAQLAQAGVDTSKLDEIAAGIKANTDALSAAVARDTDAHDEIHAAGM